MLRNPRALRHGQRLNLAAWHDRRAATVAWLVATAVLLVGLSALLSYAADGLRVVCEQFPESPSPRYITFATILGAIVALLGVIAAILTFTISSRANRVAQRKQHMITILLGTRLSDQFQMINMMRKAIYPSGETVDPTVFYADYRAPYAPARNSATCRRRAAEALVSPLNYSEFLAMGLDQGDLDETMLRKTVRGIMYRLVDDAREIIASERRENDKTFEHLAALYANWRDPDAVDSARLPNERPIPA